MGLVVALVIVIAAAASAAFFVTRGSSSSKASKASTAASPHPTVTTAHAAAAATTPTTLPPPPRSTAPPTSVHGSTGSNLGDKLHMGFCYDLTGIQLAAGTPSYVATSEPCSAAGAGYVFFSSPAFFSEPDFPGIDALSAESRPFCQGRVNGAALSFLHYPGAQGKVSGLWATSFGAGGSDRSLVCVAY